MIHGREKSHRVVQGVFQHEAGPDLAGVLQRGQGALRTGEGGTGCFDLRPDRRYTQRRLVSRPRTEVFQYVAYLFSLLSFEFMVKYMVEKSGICN